MRARVVNHMSPELRYVHDRLELWGQWAHDIGVQGYPTRAITERAGEGGILAGSPRPPIEMPDGIACIDAAVARLGVIDQEVIRVYYLNWAPIETLWERCKGIHSLSNFKAVLTRSRWRISAYLEMAEVETNFQI